MTQFDQVKQYLEDAVGNTSIRAHGNFWNNLTIAQFKKYVVTVQVNIPLLTVGNGSGSNLIKALKGELPFGKNLGVPGAAFNQMPDTEQYPPMPPERIEYIKKWIDAGCPDGPTPAPPGPGTSNIG